MIFSIIRAALDYRGLPMAEKATLVMLARCCSQKDGTDIYPGLAFLEATTGASEWTIRRALKSLEKKGLITSESRKQHKGCYSLKLEALGVRPEEDKPIRRRSTDRIDTYLQPPAPITEELAPPSKPVSMALQVVGQSAAGGTVVAADNQEIPTIVQRPTLRPRQPLMSREEAMDMAARMTLDEYRAWRQAQGVAWNRAMEEWQRWTGKIE